MTDAAAQAADAIGRLVVVAADGAEEVETPVVRGERRSIRRRLEDAAFADAIDRAPGVHGGLAVAQPQRGGRMAAGRCWAARAGRCCCSSPACSDSARCAGADPRRAPTSGASGGAGSTRWRWRC